MVYPVPNAAPDERLPVQAIMWSPAPRNNALVYCRQNDIYYVPDITLDQTIRLTFDGSFNAIYNGVPDWTYRGTAFVRLFDRIPALRRTVQLLDMTNQAAIWFSPAADRIAYVSFNDTVVPEVRLPIYSEPDSFNLYTEQVIIRYPTVSPHLMFDPFTVRLSPLLNSHRQTSHERVFASSISWRKPVSKGCDRL